MRLSELRGAVSTASGVELFETLPFIRRPARWLENHPTLHGLTLAAFGLRKPLFVDHVVRPEPRPEFRPIRDLLDKDRNRYAERLRAFVDYAEKLGPIPLRGSSTGSCAYWNNGWLPPLDALALCGFLAEGNPARYIEVGSGNSTKFARHTITALGLRSHITSIDPAPRATVDRLCDEVIRMPLQHADLDVFSELASGDIVFIDGSHRIHMGSDVAVFFFEVLPRLRPGVLVHVHDIMLPRDYPESWRWRHYSEQYLLAALLMSAPERFSVELPNAYVHGVPELAAIAAPVWERAGVIHHYEPGSFWWRHEPTEVA